MRRRASRSSFFVATAVVAALSCVSEAAHADETAQAYGPPPAADVAAPKAKALVRLHVYAPADAPHVQLYEREGTRDTLVCSSPCHPTVAYDAHLVVRFGDGASSKPIDVSLGSEVDVIVKPGGDYETAGVLAVIGAVAAAAGSACLFVRMGDVPAGPINERIGHTLGYGAAGMATLGVGAGLGLVGVRLLRDPGPKTPDVSVRPVARR